MKIGSVCTGAAGLEMAALSLFPDAEVVWHSEYDPDPENKDSAARFLKWRYPEIPNHGDLRAMPWEDVEPVDLLCGGFPCQGQSAAGRKLGTEDERWLFDDIADGIGRMGSRPRLLLFENTPGLRTVQHGHAMARVVHRLAALGYVGSWRLVRASDVGACHRRERIVIVAADAAHLGQVWSGRARGRRSGPADDRGRPADASGPGLEERRQGHAGECAATDPSSPGRRQAQPRVGGGSAGQVGLRTPESGRRSGDVVADASGHRRREGRAEPAGELGRPDAAERGTGPGADADRDGRPRVTERNLGPEAGLATSQRDDAQRCDLEWGRYAGAVARHERVLGRPAPSATVPRGRGGAERLNPVLVEWMMMLPAGHVTDCPELTANQMLHLLGNGVVPPAIALAAADLFTDYLEIM